MLGAGIMGGVAGRKAGGEGHVISWKWGGKEGEDAGSATEPG